jgi:1-acyl-sn-glycerol-3-phosphate acyltransferase
MVRNIIGRIMALWALIVFAVTMLLFWIPIWVTGLWKEPKRTIYVFYVFRLWMDSFFILTGVRRKIKGRENFKNGVAYIVVCNHNSFMDPPLSSPGIPGVNKTIAKEEMAKIPLFGMVYRRGSVLVNRKSEESRRKSYLKMKEVLDMGFHMCIYPEGTRNKTSAPMTKFHDGAFKLAIDTRKQIMPAVMFNTAKVLPTHKSFFFWPQKVEMHFLPPVGIENKSVTDLKNEVYTIMENYYVSHQ